MNRVRIGVYGVPLIAAMGFAPGSATQAEIRPPAMLVALADDDTDDEDAKLWDEMYWLIDTLLWLLSLIEETEQSAHTAYALVLKTEAETVALVNTQIASWEANGLKPGLSAQQRSQGVVDCDNVLAFIAANPGMLSATLEGQYINMVQELRAALLN